MWENARRLAAFVAGEGAVAEAKVRREAASTSTSASAPVDSMAMPREWSERQRDKLLEILNKSVVDIEKLQQISWGGIPQDLRPICWQLMLGYLPRQTSSWQDVVDCKRKAYRELLKTHYEVSNSRKR